jgi:hypothetical protein
MRVTDRHLIEVAHTIGDIANVVAGHLDHGALARIDDTRRGIPAARYDRGGGVAGIVADPTANTAIAALEWGADVATQHRYELERLMLRAIGSLRRAQTIIDLYGEPRSASESDRLALARINTPAEPGCASCARTTGPGGGPRWEPVCQPAAGREPVGPTDVNGRLPEPMLLCRWCRDCVHNWGRLPSERELERHHQGLRVPWPADIPRPPGD